MPGQKEPHAPSRSAFTRPVGQQQAEPAGNGKVVEHAAQRFEDTIRNNLTWWYYGPSHPKTRQSVANINKLHGGGIR